MARSFHQSFLTDFKKQKSVKIAGLVVATILVVVLVRRMIPSNTTNATTSQTDSQQGLLETQPLDVTLNIPIDEKGNNSIVYKVTGAEIRNSIVLRGQRARAIEGRKFVILNLKLTNSLEQRVSLNSRDYVRMSLAGSEDRLAPSIHNDPVELQPISDQTTRLGFSVDASATNFKFYVGEISGEKQEVEVVFSQ